MYTTLYKIRHFATILQLTLVRAHLRRDAAIAAFCQSEYDYLLCTQRFWVREALTYLCGNVPAHTATVCMLFHPSIYAESI